VRNADPDADAGSVVRCCGVPHLTTVPVRGRTRGSGPRSGYSSQSSNRVPHLFKAKNVKHKRIHPKVGTDPNFLSKNIMVKIFLKLLGVTRTRIRILGSGSVKKFIKTENANDSGSANHTKLNANGSGSGFLNPDSGIFMRTPDSHRIRTVRYGPLLRI
jgi:hypothetical protein